MPTIGDGFVGSIGHKHFLKVFVGLVVIILAAWYSYHSWFKADQAQIPVSQFQATDKQVKTQ